MIAPNINRNHQEIDGRTFKEMFAFAIDWFAKSESDVNILNVFPVPDGDTGTNMLLTMKSSLEEAVTSDPAGASGVSEVAQAMAYGALMGARGNSGVILCQIWRGLAGSLRGKVKLCGVDLAEALQNASRTAYEGIEKPVEGTILTVMKDIAAATIGTVSNNDNVTMVMQKAVSAAARSVANTPNLLPVLKEAGVVDSGGQGLYILLEGALMFLNHQTQDLVTGKSVIIAADLHNSYSSGADKIQEEVPFGYCIEFLLKGQHLSPDEIRNSIKQQGESLIVTGDSSTVRIHIHCPDPSPVIHYALSLGSISAVSIRNMDEQNADLKKLQNKKKTATQEVSVVAVATGEGIIDTFNSLGVSAIVPGGPTMNPSTKQILDAVESLPSGNIIILPDDKNLVMVAQQVVSLSSRKVGVLPVVSIPQGIAAMLAYDPKLGLDVNLQAMQESSAVVRTVEVTRAVRSTRINGFSINKGQALALLDGKILAAENDINELMKEILGRIGLPAAETVSIYYGADVDAESAGKVREMMYRLNDKLNIDVVNGGQPLYQYIISIE